MDRILKKRFIQKTIGVLAITAMIACLPSHLFAFSPESRTTITLYAFRLMPPSLRTQLEKHKKDCLMGTLEPMLNEGEQNHDPGIDGKVTAEKIARQARAIVNMIDNREPFRKVIYEMGVLSHHITDLNFPLTKSGEGKEHYDAFAQFCQSKEDKVQFVFYGFYDPHLSGNDLHAFAVKAFQRSASHIPYVKESFHRIQHGSQAEFDDRSILFGIAAISFSHAVTDIARTWLYIWDQAHGDFAETPHLETLKQKE